MVVFADDVNGYVGRINIAYAGVHGYGIRNTDGSRVREFADSLGLVLWNTCFMKQDSKLVLCRCRSITSRKFQLNYN